MSVPAQPQGELLRFADILTTASAAANYLGEGIVVARHLLFAVAILSGEMTLEDLGRAVSPLVRRTPPGMGSAVEPAVQVLAQRWFAALGSDTDASISANQLAELVAELHHLNAEGRESPVPPD